MIHIEKLNSNITYCNHIAKEFPLISWVGENKLDLRGVDAIVTTRDNSVCIICLENFGASRLVSQVDTKRLIEG